VRAILRHRGFQLLLAGQTLSMFGSSAMLLVLGIWTKALTGSNSMVGLVFLLLALPAVATPLLGVAIDRFPRRQVMIVTDLLMAAVLSTLLFVHDEGDVWIIFAVAVVYALGQPVFGSAKAGLLRGMLEEEHLAAANGLLESLRQALRICSPLAGAGLYTVLGGGAVAVLDAATFLASAALLAGMRVPDIERVREPLRFWSSFTGGVAHIWRTAELRLLVGAVFFAVCVVGLLEGAVFFALLDALGKPPEFIGVISTVQGAGSITGGLLAGVAISRLGELRVSAVGILGIGAGFALMATLSLPFVFGACVLIGVTLTPFMVAFNTLVQRRTALELQGRVFTAIEALLSAPFALSMGIGAGLVAVVDIRVLYLVVAASLVLVGGALMVWRLEEARPAAASA
jgi:MFS family permease